MVLVAGRNIGLFIVSDNDMDRVLLTEGDRGHLKAMPSGCPEGIVKPNGGICRALHWNNVWGCHGAPHAKQDSKFAGACELAKKNKRIPGNPPR